MLKTLLSCLSLCFALALSAQMAQVQIIHNSPTIGTDGGPDVDIYANGALLVGDVAYRTATAYTSVPAGVAIDVAVAPGDSDSVDDAIFTTTLPALADGEDYVVYAHGAIGDMDQPFTLSFSDLAEQTTDAGAGLVDILAFHGALDAPGVDILSGILTIVDDLEYGTFDDPNPVPAASYTLTVTSADNSVVVGDYTVDVSMLGGQGINVFASGVLNNTPEFGFFAALSDGTVVELPAVQPATANVQIIHNSPTPGTDGGPAVDVYAAGQLLLDSFVYRTATPYVPVPAGVGIPIAVALAGSDSADDAFFTTTLGPLDDGANYVVYANGVAGDMDMPFDLVASASATPTASGMDIVDLLVFHGAVDAPNVEVTVGDFTLASDLAFGAFADIQDIDADDYVIDVLASTTNMVLGSFDAPLAGAGGAGLNVFASGVAGDTPGFGLYLATPAGDVFALPEATSALFQIVHASPTPGTGSGPAVDIYLDSTLFGLLENISYLSATPLLRAGTGTYQIDVVPTGADISESIFTTDYNLTPGARDVIYAVGIAGDADNPFQLAIDDVVLTNPSVDDVRLNVFHASAGAPNVDVAADGVGVIVDDLAFPTGEFVSVPTADYFLDVNVAGTDNTVARVLADLESLGAGGGAFPFFAGGIAGDADDELNLYLVVPNGAVIPMLQQAQVQVIHNSPSPTVDVYINGARALDDFEFRTATPYIDLNAGDVELAVAPGDSDSVDDAIFTTGTITLDPYTNYQVMAFGEVGNTDRPFGLGLLADARQGSDSDDNVDIIAFHGGIDAPAVDVVVDADDSILFDDLEYGTYAADYVSVPAASYVLNVTPADDNGNIVAAFIADVSGLGGGAATVFASGYLTPDGDQPGFGLYATLPDGTTFPLEVTTGTDELAAGVDALAVFPTVADSEVNVAFALNRSADTQVVLVNAAGTVLRTNRFGQLNGEQLQTLDVSQLGAGQHYLLLRTDDRVTVRPFSVQR